MLLNLLRDWLHIIPASSVNRLSSDLIIHENLQVLLSMALDRILRQKITSWANKICIIRLYLEW